MYDNIEKIGGSTIQHGKLNDRIYLMKLHPDDMPDILKKLNDIAKAGKYGKICAKVPKNYSNLFIKKKYIEEASVPGFYGGTETCSFMSLYLNEQRREVSSAAKAQIKDILKTALSKQISPHGKNAVTLSAWEDALSIRKLCLPDAPDLSKLYRTVFKSYPFPVHETQFIEKSMEEHTEFYGAVSDKGIVSASSAEMDRNADCAEMTDFATLCNFRGKSISLRLLSTMEEKIKAQGIKTCYTIARAHSYGMNITFAKAGYKYAGTLFNNTNISGRIESMNIWYKPLS